MTTRTNQNVATPQVGTAAPPPERLRRPRGVRPWIGAGRFRLLVGAGSLLAGAMGWQVAGMLQENNLFIPTFVQTADALAGQLGTSGFWGAYATTLVPFIVGWLLALVVGLGLGIAIGLVPLLSRALMPYLAFLNALPVSALVPIVVIAAGIDIAAGATLVFLFAIVDVVLTSSAGVRYVDKDLIAMARSFGMGRLLRFRRVVWLGAMPGILAAVRVGTGRAIVGMVVMELLLVSSGVGKLVTRYKDTFQSAELYAVVMSLGIFGLVMLGLTRALERRVLRWQPSRRNA